MPNKQIAFTDYCLFSGALGDFQNVRPLLINTINQYSYCVAENDSEFKKALIKSDILLPDGIGVVLATGFLTGQKIRKIAGADIHQYYLNYLNENNGSCFYMGSSESTLEKIQLKLSELYPKIRVATYSPPFKAQFTTEDNNNIIEAINKFKPNVVFVGMTAPKQEKWAYKHQNLLDTDAICTIGAVFDFYAGTVDRPSKFWINMGLEWLIRLANEPKRMWKRYLYYGPVFLYQIIKQKILKTAN